MHSCLLSRRMHQLKVAVTLPAGRTMDSWELHPMMEHAMDTLGERGQMELLSEHECIVKVRRD